MNSVVFANKPAAIEEASRREAYESVLPELEDFPADKLLVVNADPVAIVTAALGALPRIFAQREALATLPDFDLGRFDKLEIYARTLTYAHHLFQVASQPPDDLKGLQEEASQLRELLYQDASVAIVRGILPKDSLDDLKGANGYRNTAGDLQILAVALSQKWENLQGKVGTTEEELAYADKLAFHLLRVFGLRENGPEAVAEVSDKRTRAFSLFVSTYEDARLAITYLHRAIGDGDKIAPSLYLFRSNTRKKDASEVDAPSGQPESPSGPPAAAPLTAPAPATSVNPADPYAD